MLLAGFILDYFFQILKENVWVNFQLVLHKGALSPVEMESTFYFCVGDG